MSPSPCRAYWATFLLAISFCLLYQAQGHRFGFSLPQSIKSMFSHQQASAESPQSAVVREGRVHYDAATGSFSVAQRGYEGSSPAHGTFSEASEHVSGFGQLRITTNSAYPDNIQMQAAGFLEGYLTAERIFDHSYNMKSWLESQCNDTFKIGDWLFENDAFIRDQVNSHAGSSDPFWPTVGLVQAQADGMLAGYSARLAELGPEPALDRLTKWDFLLLNALGDIDDLLAVLFPPAPDTWTGLTPGQVRSRVAKAGRCSVLIKVTPDFSDLLLGHVTWWTYTSMVRIYKHYAFNLNHPAMKGNRMSFPSYPGLISSMDDWYVLGSGLVVTETSNDVYDQDLYRKVTPRAALSWHRVLAANLLAGDGAEWAHWVGVNNSGTYNNQYMIVDMKRFEPGSELKKGLLTVTELIPGLAVTADTTQELERGYWPSYNVPYFPEIYNATGYPLHASQQAARGQAYKEAVSGLSYQLAPRAKIFRRDSGPVSDLSGLKSILRSSGWPNDAFSTESPWDTICARGDLDPEDPDAYGCLDAKVTSYRLALKMGSEAVSGPPRGPGLPPFTWAGKWSRLAHRGMPETYDTQRFEVQEP